MNEIFWTHLKEKNVGVKEEKLIDFDFVNC